MNVVPDWLNRKEYPFPAHYVAVQGALMHYVDEGEGNPIVFLHGTPSWSFDFRNQIKALSPTHRCIAPDLIGFGLSDKPANYNYTLQQHTDNLAMLLAHLNLHKFTLLVHDFGGPIGLNYATQHPEKIERLVILNTWFWATQNEPEYKKALPVLKSPLLPVLYKYFNFSARFMVKQSWGNKAALTKQIHQHYIKPFSKPAERMGTIAFARTLVNEQEWFETLWKKTEVLANKPTLIIWGTLDEFVPVRYADKIKSRFTNSQFAGVNAGHFPQDEAHIEVNTALQLFLNSTNIPHSITTATA